MCTVVPDDPERWISFASPEVERLYASTMQWAERSPANRGPFEEIQKQVESLARQQNISPEQLAVDLYFAANAGVAAYPNPLTPLLDQHGEKSVPWLVTRITASASRAERVFLLKRLLKQTSRERTASMIAATLNAPSLNPQQREAWSDLQGYLSSLPK